MHRPDDHWYFAIDDERRGPFTRGQMRAQVAAGTIRPTTLVWNPDLPHWTPMASAGLAEASLPPEAPPLPAASARGFDVQAYRALARPAGGGLQPAYAGVDALEEDPDTADADLSMWGYFVRVFTRDLLIFSGRARRKEAIGFIVWLFLTFFVLAFVGALTDTPLLLRIVEIASWMLIIPSTALLVRRLHDVGWSGWWALTFLIPVVGLLVVVALHLIPSEPRPNRFGPVPAGVRVG